MIKLDVESYCECCPDFDPKVEQFTYHDGMTNKYKKCDTTVFCKYKNRCAQIAKYINMNPGSEAVNR